MYFLLYKEWSGLSHALVWVYNSNGQLSQTCWSYRSTFWPRAERLHPVAGDVEWSWSLRDQGQDCQGCSRSPCCGLSTCLAPVPSAVSVSSSQPAALRLWSMDHLCSATSPPLLHHHKAIAHCLSCCSKSVQLLLISEGILLNSCLWKPRKLLN